MSKKPILPPNQPILNPIPEKLSKVDLMKMLRDMILIREAEDKVQGLYMKGLIHGTTHLCQGQEAVSVGVAKALQKNDYVSMTYRGHGHAIARGMEVTSIFSELMGRATGINKGKGGSMHLSDFDLGLIGSFAIIGAGIPVALGAAMSSKIKNEKRVSVNFFGDGTTNIGAFHETLNMAAVWKAPIVFICENNIYGEFSRIDETTSVDQLSKRAAAYNMPGITINGNNILEVFEETLKAVEHAREGNGPTFIECVTYRHRGHSRTDPAKYRPEEEVKAWLNYDPINLFKDWLTEHKLATVYELKKLHDEVKAQVNEAADKAEKGPWPSLDELLTETYA
jgi:acetoin:2,6-dichlorophenolindophenol oxidoreductase subunit alpha